ncbi:MAG: RnfABCDGE type electron transport complex subunit G [Bacteroidales bacterium]|nr:RnfABCDGE type electron transport complex subunit G [Bacteroidales bacterium]
MAAASTLKNMAVCLTVVCLICSAVVGAAYAVTADPIAAAAQAKTTASIAAVLPAFDGTPEQGSIQVDGVDYTYYKAADAGYAIISTTSGFGGALTLMVGVENGGTIHNTAVLSHSETPGLGAKCTTDASFIDQFKGFNPAERTLTVKKDGGDLDAITASTITSRAYALAVSNAVAVYHKLTEGGQSNE